MAGAKAEPSAAISVSSKDVRLSPICLRWLGLPARGGERVTPESGHARPIGWRGRVQGELYFVCLECSAIDLYNLNHRFAFNVSRLVWVPVPCTVRSKVTLFFAQPATLAIILCALTFPLIVALLMASITYV